MCLTGRDTLTCSSPGASPAHVGDTWADRHPNLGRRSLQRLPESSLLPQRIGSSRELWHGPPPRSSGKAALRTTAPGTNGDWSTGRPGQRCEGTRSGCNSEYTRNTKQSPGRCAYTTPRYTQAVELGRTLSGVWSRTVQPTTDVMSADSFPRRLRASTCTQTAPSDAPGAGNT